MFRYQTFYAPELGENITVRGLSAAGVFRVDRMIKKGYPQGAQNIAVIAEHLRDGMTTPTLRTNEELLRFIERYPELAARTFAAVRHLTEGGE